MELRKLLLQSPEYVFQNNLFYQRDLAKDTSFEAIYLSLRDEEGRVYSDDVVRSLPDVPANHPLQKEWRMRKATLLRLMRYLRKVVKRKQITIL